MNDRVNLNSLAIRYSPYQPGQGPDFGRDRTAGEESRQDRRTQSGTAPSDYVLRGELLDPVDYHKRYRYQHHQEVAPQNRRAIESYHAGDSLITAADPRGRLLDQYV